MPFGAFNVSAYGADRSAMIAQPGMSQVGTFQTSSMHPVYVCYWGKVYGKLAKTPAWLVSVQIEDMLGWTEQANLPGMTDSHPNWRRRLPVVVETIAANADAVAIAEVVNAHRGSGRRSGENRESDKAT